jgi:hypothetical protein
VASSLVPRLHAVISGSTRARIKRTEMAAADALGQLRLENEASSNAIDQLRLALVRQAEEIKEAEERKRALTAERSRVLVEFARRHAEEEEQKRALDCCRKGIADAWLKIKALQQRRAEVLSKQLEHAAADARLRKMQSEHMAAAERTRARALLPERLLQAECDDILAALTAEDERRYAAEEAQRTASEEAQRARDEEASERARQEEAAAAAATEREAAQSGMTDEELSKAILDLLQSHGRADADAMGRSLGRCPRLDAVLQELKANFFIFELEPGLFGLL